MVVENLLGAQLVHIYPNVLELMKEWQVLMVQYLIPEKKDKSLSGFGVAAVFLVWGLGPENG